MQHPVLKGDRSGQVTSNTATNGQRIENVGQALASMFPAVAAEEEVVVTARWAIEMHHQLPQAGRFAKFFRRAGLNIEDFRIPLNRATHRLNPGGIHTKAGGDWNGVWDKFFEANPNATKNQILEQLQRMRADFGI